MKIYFEKAKASKDVGSTIVEYCLVLCFLTLTAVPALSALGSQVGQQFQKASNEMSAEQEIFLPAFGGSGSGVGFDSYEAGAQNEGSDPDQVVP